MSHSVINDAFKKDLNGALTDSLNPPHVLLHFNKLDRKSESLNQLPGKSKVYDIFSGIS